VSIDEALLAHSLVIEQFGGRLGILNRNGLESALARPYSGYYRSIERKGAALLESLAKNHGFVDGNKRTAILMLSLLVINSGYDFHFESNETANDSLEVLVLDIVERRMTYAQVVSWLRKHVRKST
jgi:death-on-curing protein